MARTKQQMRKSFAARSFKKPAFSRKAATQTIRTERRNDGLSVSRGRRPSNVDLTLAETETKFFDTTFSGSTSVATDASGAELDPSTVLCLNAMAQGDTQNTREGNRTVVTGCSIRGQATLAATQDSADPVGSPFVRLFLVQDKHTTGGNATGGEQLNSEDVFVNNLASANGAALVFRNRNRSSRYKVLASTIIQMPNRPSQTDGTNTGAQGAAWVPFDIYWKGNMKVKHSANNGTIADIVDNSLHVIGYSSQSAVQIVYAARVDFVG